MSRKRQLTMEEAFGAGGTIRRLVGDGHDEGGGDLPRPSVGKKPEATAKATAKHLAVGGSPCRARRSRAAARSSSGPRRSRESSSSDTGSSELWEPEADPNSSDSSPDSPRATGRAVSRVLAQSRSTNAGKRRPTGATLSRGAASVSPANTGVKKRVAKGKGGTWRKSGWKPTVQDENEEDIEDEEDEEDIEDIEDKEDEEDHNEENEGRQGPDSPVRLRQGPGLHFVDGGP
uniref:Uncharacterized protein n=1 Tax=Knipowitschia caucasica TaxID=637954 RepID=A0AAV2JG37_KNICA